MTERVLDPEQVRALRKMSLGKRLTLNASLRESAHLLKQAALRARHPESTRPRASVHFESQGQADISSRCASIPTGAGGR